MKKLISTIIILTFSIQAISTDYPCLANSHALRPMAACVDGKPIIGPEQFGISDSHIRYARKHGFYFRGIRKDFDPDKISALHSVNIGIISFNGWCGEDELTILRAQRRFKGVNAIIVNRPEDILIEGIGRSQRALVERGFIFIDDELVFVEFQKPITIHYAINHFQEDEIGFNNDLVNTGIPVMGAAPIAYLTQDKLFTGQALRDSGVAVPREPDYYDWHTRGTKLDDNGLDILIEEFMRQCGIREIVAKPRTGARGDGILYLKDDNPKETIGQRMMVSLGEIWPDLLWKIIIQERIFPPKLKLVVDDKEEEFDWNLRSFVIRNPDGTLTVKHIVRYGKGVVNICKGAKVMSIDKFFNVMKIPRHAQKGFLQRADDAAKKAFESMHSHIRDMVAAARDRNVSDSPFFRHVPSGFETDSHIGADMLFEVGANLDNIEFIAATRTNNRDDRDDKPVVYCADPKYLEEGRSGHNIDDLGKFGRIISGGFYKGMEGSYKVSVHLGFTYGIFPCVKKIIVKKYDTEPCLQIEIARDKNGNVYPLYYSDADPNRKRFDIDKAVLAKLYELIFSEVQRVYKYEYINSPILKKILTSPVMPGEEESLFMDFMGIDQIYNGSYEPLIMEVNDHYAGGMWDINQVEDADKQDETVVPIYEIAISKAREYKEQIDQADLGRLVLSGERTIEKLDDLTERWYIDNRADASGIERIYRLFNTAA